MKQDHYNMELISHQQSRFRSLNFSQVDFVKIWKCFQQKRKHS